MYKTTLVSAILAISTLTTVSASANDNHDYDKEGLYVTVGGTILSTELDLNGIDVAGETVDLGVEDTTITMLNGRIGYRFNDYLAVEGELGFGLGGDEFDRTIPVDVLGTPVNVDSTITLDVKNYYIAFARGIFPVSDDFDIFARVGYGQATAEADIVGTALGFTAAGSAEQDEDGIAYGVGAQYNISHKDGIRADYTRLDETNIISLAYSRSF